MSNDTITIPLSKHGKYKGQHETIISLEDAEYVQQFNWCLMSGGSNRKYAYRKIYPKGESPRGIRLHRVIMERKLGRILDSHEQVDHINGNGLDNRRDNLRLATYIENNRNAKRRIDNASGYKGVYWKEKNKKWCAQIRVNKKQIYLGLFDTKEQAYEAYCQAADKYFGEFANHGND